jgi:Serine carboxypeptidase S28
MGQVMLSRSPGSWRNPIRVPLLASKQLCFRGIFATMIFVSVLLLLQYLLPSTTDFPSLRDVNSVIKPATFIASGSSGTWNLTVDLPIDHFNPQDTRTFKNRYWMNDTFYQQGGPVFLHDAGEATVPLNQARQLASDQLVFAAMELGKKYHGIAILWEHRFFGQSLPFALDPTTGLAREGYDAYKYLDNEQALQDVVYFATHFQPPGHEYDTLTSNSTPWVWIGGSYPGIRAAIIRQRNPDVFLCQLVVQWSS